MNKLAAELQGVATASPGDSVPGLPDMVIEALS